jgi:hypothetical protein
MHLFIENVCIGMEGSWTFGPSNSTKAVIPLAYVREAHVPTLD